MFTTVQFDSLSTELKQRMRSPSPVLNSEWRTLYRELPDSINENVFSFIHIESNTPIFLSKDDKPRSIDFIPVFLTENDQKKNNNSTILVHLDFDKFNRDFKNVGEAKRILSKWSEYIYQNLRQFHPTAGRIEFQIVHEQEQRGMSPIQLYNQRNKKGRMNKRQEYSPTVLIDSSSITDLTQFESTQTTPDFTFKFIEHRDTYEDEFFPKVAKSISNGMVILYSNESSILNQILRIAEVMSIRYMVSNNNDESLVNSFLHNGFRASSITGNPRTGCVLSPNREIERTTTSKRIVFKSLTEGLKRPSQRTKFYDSLNEFNNIIYECLYVKGEKLRDSFEIWRNRYRDFCWELIDDEEKDRRRRRNQIHPNDQMNAIIKKQIRACEDEAYLRDLVSNKLQIKQTIRMNQLSTDQTEFKTFKKIILNIFNSIGRLLKEGFDRNPPSLEYQEKTKINSKYDLEKKPGIYTGLSNLHHPNTDEDLEGLENRGIDFSLVQRLAVYDCVKKFIENLRSIVRIMRGEDLEAVSSGLKEFFSIEYANQQGGEF